MSLEADLEALEAMDLASLRRAWRPAYGPRPTFRSSDILRRLIAWHIQAAARGAGPGDQRRAAPDDGRRNTRQAANRIAPEPRMEGRPPRGRGDGGGVSIRRRDLPITVDGRHAHCRDEVERVAILRPG